MFADMRTAVNGRFGSSTARSTERFRILNAAVGHNFRPALTTASPGWVDLPAVVLVCTGLPELRLLLDRDHLCRVLGLEPATSRMKIGTAGLLHQPRSLRAARLRDSGRAGEPENADELDE